MDFDIELGKEDLSEEVKADVDVSAAHSSTHESVSRLTGFETDLLIIFSMSSGDNGALVS